MCLNCPHHCSGIWRLSLRKTKATWMQSQGVTLLTELAPEGPPGRWDLGISKLAPEDLAGRWDLGTGSQLGWTSLYHFHAYYSSPLFIPGVFPIWYFCGSIDLLWMGKAWVWLLLQIAKTLVPNSNTTCSWTVLEVRCPKLVSLSWNNKISPPKN